MSCQGDGVKTGSQDGRRRMREGDGIVSILGIVVTCMLCYHITFLVPQFIVVHRTVRMYCKLLTINRRIAWMAGSIYVL